MKSRKDIKYDLLELEKEASEIPSRFTDAREAKRAKTKKIKLTKRIVLLRQCLKYLEHSPTIGSVSRQYDEVALKIKRIGLGFNDWLLGGNGVGLKNKKTAYESDMGLKNLKAAKATLKYLLD